MMDVSRQFLAAWLPRFAAAMGAPDLPLPLVELAARERQLRAERCKRVPNVWVQEEGEVVFRGAVHDSARRAPWRGTRGGESSPNRRVPLTPR
jgi:hypothetical protein